MHEWNKTRIAEILIEAGRMALRYYDAPQRSIKDDGSIVTNADREIEQFFQECFDRPEHNVYMIGEETESEKSADYVSRALAQTMYIVDPIDGTVPYACHVPVWGISIGLAVGGVIREGAIYLPITRELFVSDGDMVLRAVVAPAADSAAEFMPVERPETARTDDGLIAVTQDITKIGGIGVPNPVQALACAVMPLSYLLLGRYMAYVGNLKLWDLAGGLPLLHKLGIGATFLCGKELSCRISDDFYFLDKGRSDTWKIRDSCLFAAPPIAAALLPTIRT